MAEEVADGIPAKGVATEGIRPTCATCGAIAADDGALLTWSLGVENGRSVRTCPDCARRFVRSIEGKLDSDWW